MLILKKITAHQKIYTSEGLTKMGNNQEICKQASNVFATKCAQPSSRASCTSPTQNVTSLGNVTFYRLLVVTLSQRARLPLKRAPPLGIFPAAQTLAGYGCDCDCAYKGATMS